MLEELIQQRTAALFEANARLQQGSIRDPLTGCTTGVTSTIPWNGRRDAQHGPKADWDGSACGCASWRSCIASGPVGIVTTSVGVAALPDHDTTPAELIE